MKAERAVYTLERSLLTGFHVVKPHMEGMRGGFEQAIPSKEAFEEYFTL